MKKKKKHVLILNYGLHISGVSRTLVNFANCLAQHGYDVTIRLETNDFTLAKELDARVKCRLFLNEWKLFGRYIKGFLRFYELYRKLLFHLPTAVQYLLVVHKKYDVEIAFNRGAAARIIAASLNRKAKKIAWVHNDYMRNSNPLAGFSNLEDAARAYATYDHVICVSEQAERSFKQKFGDTGNLVTRYNIMDISQIYRCAEEFVPITGKFTIVAVGRLSQQKNYRLLLDAAAEIRRRGIDFNLWIIGDGEQKQELLQYKTGKGLDFVSFLGAKENPYPYFAAADVYVSSSIYEGLSTTTIEALILGKPIVVTDCTGMREILGDSEWGIIVPIEIKALASALERMMTDPELRRHYAAQSRIRAKAFFPEESFRKIEELMC